MRKPIVAANWKMNKTHLEAIHFVEALLNRLNTAAADKVDVVICPPFTAIRSVQTTIDGDDLPFGLGAQNMYWEASGAYTGEISAEMLTKLSVGYVILGHSERRELFGETDENVNRKAMVALQNGLTPIVCVGETLEEREAGATEKKVSGQIVEGLKGLTPEQVSGIVVAYEPIWAIGTGKNASGADAQETIAVIRQTVREAFGEAADDTRIQYGGSVKSANIDDFVGEPDVDGALVGGASLDPEEFTRIVEAFVR